MCLQTFTEIETTHFLYTTASWKIATVKQKRTKRNKRFLFYKIGDALSFLVDNQAELKRLSVKTRDTDQNLITGCQNLKLNLKLIGPSNSYSALGTNIKINQRFQQNFTMSSNLDTPSPPPAPSFSNGGEIDLTKKGGWGGGGWKSCWRVGRS